MTRLARAKKSFLSLSMLVMVSTTGILGANVPAHAVPTAAIIIDPGSSASYPGSGTTVTSIGSNTMTGTMANISYDASNGGKFVFNGTSSTISFGTFNFTSNFTILAWVKPVSQYSISTLVSNAGANGSTNGFKAYWNSWNTYDRKMIFENGNGTSGTWNITDNSAVTNASWQQVAYVVNRTSGTVSFYINGVLQSAAANSTLTDFGINQTWWIGSMAGGLYWMNADMGLFKIFTSNLSQADLASEFSASSSRYGLPVTPTISSNPVNRSVSFGNTANFAVTSTVSDAGTLSYQWQLSTDSGSTWNNVSTGTGGTTNSYTTASTTVSMSGYQYRVVVTNTLSGNTSSTTSSVATLTVTQATPNIGLSIPIGSTTIAAYRSTITLTLTSNAPGKIGLKANGKWIPGCRNLAITTSVICNYKPSLHGQIAITASFEPTSTANYSSVRTSPAYIVATARSNKR